MKMCKSTSNCCFKAVRSKFIVFARLSQHFRYLMKYLHFKHFAHAWIQDFFRGGPGPTARKQSGRCFFDFLVLLILQFTEGVQWFYYSEKDTFPRIQRGSNIFQGGGGSNFFQGGGGGGVQMLNSIETHIK